jgi:CheY-like chemotaxis protein
VNADAGRDDRPAIASQRDGRVAWTVQRESFMPEATERVPGSLLALVADDDEDMRALVAGVLSADGYTVLEACDGEELLEQLERSVDDPLTRPDVVVTDIMMPRLSGLGVLDAIRRAQLHLPVVLMTVLPDEAVYLVARRLGAAGVLHKPFGPAEIRAAVVRASLTHATRPMLRP